MPLILGLQCSPLIHQPYNRSLAPAAGQLTPANRISSNLRGHLVSGAASRPSSVVDETINDTLTTPTLSIESVAYTEAEGTFSVTGRLRSNVPPSLVYEVLTDYTALPRVFHNVDECSVKLTEDGDKCLLQTCSWRFLIFAGRFVTELEVAEEPETRKLAFSLLQSAFMRSFIGSWHIEPNSTGGSDIHHSLSVQPAVSPPQKLGDFAKAIFKSQVESILEDLDVELDRRHTGDAAI